MNTAIIVKFQVEALHAWPGVKDHPELKDRVGFLQFPHRHIFHFKAVKKVSHADRDIEIIDLKRMMIHYLLSKYGKNPVGLDNDPNPYKSHCDFGAQSCEMLGAELVQKFMLHSCEVLEDNENGAVVDAQPSTFQTINERRAQMKEEFGMEDPSHPRYDFKGITFICGPLASGKSYIGGALSQRGALQVEVSRIVKSIKKLSGTASRKDMQGSPELDVEIIESIADVYKANNKPENDFQMVVTGVRQVSILQAFPNATCVWIDAPPLLRNSRFLQNAKDKGTSFDEADDRDVALGLLDVKKYIFTRNTL